MKAYRRMDRGSVHLRDRTVWQSVLLVNNKVPSAKSVVSVQLPANAPSKQCEILFELTLDIGVFDKVAVEMIRDATFGRVQIDGGEQYRFECRRYKRDQNH